MRTDQLELVKMLQVFSDICEKNGINMENVMAIGDSENDEDFLREVGVKIAVGNADETLKEISTYTCKRNFGDGVAEAIEKFALR